MANFNGVAMLIASSGRQVNIEWSLSLPTFQYPVGMSAAWFLCIDKDRAAQREKLLEKAVDIGAEYAMFIDDDTLIPNYSIQQLHYHLSQNPDVAVCGGIYCTKTEFPEPIVFKELGAGPFWKWSIGDVFECKGLGTGCMMIRCEALKSLSKPWFSEPKEAPVGEIATFNGTEIEVGLRESTDDLYFCRKLTEAKWKILAHGGILPVHIGQEGKFYTLPVDSWPCKAYSKEIAAAKAAGKREVIYSAKSARTQIEEGS